MTREQHAVLHALFALARADRYATVLRVVRFVSDLGLPMTKQDVEGTLRALDAAGLVDASRVRLSMQGFAIASVLGRPAVRQRRAVPTAA
ncbi:MAG: hypothetical protein U0271_28635 [Polyangiaceae bacterium]